MMKKFVYILVILLLSFCVVAEEEGESGSLSDIGEDPIEGFDDVAFSDDAKGNFKTRGNVLQVKSSEAMCVTIGDQDYLLGDGDNIIYNKDSGKVTIKTASSVGVGDSLIFEPSGDGEIISYGDNTYDVTGKSTMFGKTTLYLKNNDGDVIETVEINGKVKIFTDEEGVLVRAGLTPGASIKTDDWHGRTVTNTGEKYIELFSGGDVQVDEFTEQVTNDGGEVETKTINRIFSDLPRDASATVTLENGRDIYLSNEGGRQKATYSYFDARWGEVDDEIRFQSYSPRADEDIDLMVVQKDGTIIDNSAMAYVDQDATENKGLFLRIVESVFGTASVSKNARTALKAVEEAG